MFTMSTAMTERKGKAGPAIGTRLYEDELEKWNALMGSVQRRIKIAKPSDVLRDLIFGGLGLVTEEERAALRGGNTSVFFRVPIVGKANAGEKQTNTPKRKKGA
jgi:hypothetical protein